MNAITIKNIPILLLMAVGITCLSSCSEEITDFGFDGQISGMVLDGNGNPVSGDVSSAAMTVYALGAEDRVPIEIRVTADGSFANLHLFPQSYNIWIEGPVDGPTEESPISVDLSGSAVSQDISVTPFIAIGTPTANISGGNVTVDFDISPNTGHTTSDRMVLVSTVAKVGVNTGSGDRWETRSVDLGANTGSVDVPLDSDLLDVSEKRGGGKLHIRIAARSNQTNDWNYSLPIVITP